MILKLLCFFMAHTIGDKMSQLEPASSASRPRLTGCLPGVLVWVWFQWSGEGLRLGLSALELTQRGTRASHRGRIFHARVF